MLTISQFRIQSHIPHYFRWSWLRLERGNDLKGINRKQFPVQLTADALFQP